jgi:hypothetical protein
LFSFQILDGLSIYTQSTWLIGLETRNLLLQKAPDGKLLVKIVDFGLSIVSSTEHPSLSTACGSATLPEMIAGESYD